VKFPPTAWSNRKFNTPSGRFEFYSAQAETLGLPALPIYVPSCLSSKEYPLRLLTPHHHTTINSQAYAMEIENEHFVFHLSPEVAQRYALTTGESAQIWNDLGMLEGIVQVENGLPSESVIIYQEKVKSDVPLNSLLKAPETDMGRLALGAPGFALNETFVNLRKTK
jgi:anaerobic selenocysteine-containing dehydrogenase